MEINKKKGILWCVFAGGKGEGLGKQLGSAGQLVDACRDCRLCDFLLSYYMLHICVSVWLFCTDLRFWPSLCPVKQSNYKIGIAVASLAVIFLRHKIGKGLRSWSWGELYLHSFVRGLLCRSEL